MSWLARLGDAVRAGHDCVLVTVAGSRGSVPREAGAKMVVTDDELHGTIGGGHLELKSTEIARAMLEHGERDSPELVRFPLGPTLGQCCGGSATVMFERLAGVAPEWLETLERVRGEGEPAVLATSANAEHTHKLIVTASARHGGLGDPVLEDAALRAAAGMLADEAAPARLLEQDVSAALLEPVRRADLQVVLFGAGHVGQALVRVLAALPCEITWVDDRPHQFPAVLPENVTAIDHPEPHRLVDEMPRGSFYLVMTHSHSLDFDLCERILGRPDRRFCGLIGSRTKRRRLERRLAAQGVDARTLTCPIGVDRIDSKHPGAIAISAAAQILQQHEDAKRPSR